MNLTLGLMPLVLIFVPTLQAQSPAIYALFNEASGLALVDAGYAQGNGYTIGQWTYDGGSDAQWQIINVGFGVYEIVNQASGLALVDAGYAQGNGARVAQWTYDGGSDGQWQIVPVGDGLGSYELINQASGLALVDAGYAQGNGYSIAQWAFDGGSDGKWQIAVLNPGPGFFDGSVGMSGPFGNGQFPAALFVNSAIPLPYQTFGDHGCPVPMDSANYYGLQIDVEYQVLDQNFNPISSDTMTPTEVGTAYFPPPFTTRVSGYFSAIGPSRISDTSLKTDVDGIFHDAPLGACLNFVVTSGLFTDQVISAVVSDHAYLVRGQRFTFTASGFKHGSVSSNLNDVNVSQ